MRSARLADLIEAYDNAHYPIDVPAMADTADGREQNR